MSKKTIAIDFDGVIHRYSKGWLKDGPSIYDPPVDGAFQAIEKLRNKGYEIVIFTARPESQHIEILEWCVEQAETYGLVFDDIAVTNIKPRAAVYIDDRAIRFTNWKDILNYF